MRCKVYWAAFLIFTAGILFFVAKAGAWQRSPQSQTTAPSDSEVRDIQQRLNALEGQLNDLSSSKDASTRQSLMQQNWQSLQQYMGWMHDRWGMGFPWMMGTGMMRGSGWMGCPMMGGTGAAWPLPHGVGPDQYLPQMRELMQRMQEQMKRIGQTADSRERQRLMQEHWGTMYQDMQTMRGMGWMWRGRMGPGMMMRSGPTPGAQSAAPLPEAGSTGAKLVFTYCTQCHAAPSPTLHSASEWASVTSRMELHMNDAMPGIKTPSQAEMNTILSYMQKHAQ